MLDLELDQNLIHEKLKSRSNRKTKSLSTGSTRGRSSKKRLLERDDPESKKKRRMIEVQEESDVDVEIAFEDTVKVEINDSKVENPENE